MHSIVVVARSVTSTNALSHARFRWSTLKLSSPSWSEHDKAGVHEAEMLTADTSRQRMFGQASVGNPGRHNVTTFDTALSL